jgi:hypothetical protein
MARPTFAQARACHLAGLAALGWTVAAHLKVPHATRRDGLRLWFRPQAVYAGLGTDFGAARSVVEDSRAVSTAALIGRAEHLAGAYARTWSHD